MNGVVDQDARDKANQAISSLERHATVTEIKLDALGNTVNEMKAQMKWFIGIVVMLFISTLTWSLAQQYNANEAQKKDMAQQIELLKEQERARNATRSEILERLPPGTSEATDTAGGVGESVDFDRVRANDGAKN